VPSHVGYIGHMATHTTHHIHTTETICATTGNLITVRTYRGVGLVLSNDGRFQYRAYARVNKLNPLASVKYSSAPKRALADIDLAIDNGAVVHGDCLFTPEAIAEWNAQ
jgi:hypothetical protein